MLKIQMVGADQRDNGRGYEVSAHLQNWSTPQSKNLKFLSNIIDIGNYFINLEHSLH